MHIYVSKVTQRHPLPTWPPLKGPLRQFGVMACTVHCTASANQYLYSLAGGGPVQTDMSQVSCWLIKDEGGILSALQGGQEKEIDHVAWKQKSTSYAPSPTLSWHPSPLPVAPCVLFYWGWPNQALYGSYNREIRI